MPRAEYVVLRPAVVKRIVELTKYPTTAVNHGGAMFAIRLLLKSKVARKGVK